VEWWIPASIGALAGLVLAIIWLVALRKLLQRSHTPPEATATEISATPSGRALRPIASFLDPDEDEPHTPLPSQSMAPLTFNRYIEVRGAIEGWTLAGMDVDLELKEVFDLQRAKYEEAHVWWMAALEGAEDRLRDVERRVEVFAERYGGTSG